MMRCWPYFRPIQILST